MRSKVVTYPLVTIGVEWNYHHGQWRRFLLRKVPGTSLAQRELLHHVAVDQPYCACCLVPAYADDGRVRCPQCGCFEGS